jgi:hypothetical protein
LVSPSEAERRELSARLHGLLTVKRDVGNNVPLAVQNDSQSASHASGDGNKLAIIDRRGSVAERVGWRSRARRGGGAGSGEAFIRSTQPRGNATFLELTVNSYSEKSVSGDFRNPGARAK